MAKVTIVGAGRTGTATAQYLAQRQIADLVLVDVIEGMPQGKALDLRQALPILGSDLSIVGSNSFTETAGSDIIVVAAGRPRTPGMSREDLLNVNSTIVREVVERSLPLSPDAIFILLTNPLDAMAYLAMIVGDLPRRRVIGQAGVLDSARMRAFVADELAVSIQNVHCYVLGSHGDDMVPLTRHSNVAGVPLVELLPPDRLKAIVDRTRNAGAEVIDLLKSGSAFSAPGAALFQLIEAVLSNRHLVVPASAFLQGEYGLSGVFLGVPVQLGRDGIERIVEYRLDADELAALQRSAQHVRETIAALGEIQPSRS
jgi:malate dehydrogenase